jgi:hypothetical protein
MRPGFVAVGLGVVVTAAAGCSQRPSGRFGNLGNRGEGEFGGVSAAPARLSGVAHPANGELHVTDELGQEHVVRADASTKVVVGGLAAPGLEAVPEGSEVQAVFAGPSTDVPAARIEVVRTRQR